MKKNFVWRRFLAAAMAAALTFSTAGTTLEAAAVGSTAATAETEERTNSGTAGVPEGQIVDESAGEQPETENEGKEPAQNTGDAADSQSLASENTADELEPETSKELETSEEPEMPEESETPEEAGNTGELEKTGTADTEETDETAETETEGTQWEAQELAPLESLMTEDGIYGEYGTYSLQSMSRSYAAGSGLYSDVPEVSGWRYEAIRYVTEHGIMNGISGTGTFAPDDMMTRAMVATVLYRMDGSPQTAYASIFPDVPNGNYYSVPITWGNRAGILRGHSNTGLFGTYENITREDLVTILYRYAQYKGKNTSKLDSLSSFPDVGQISGYAKVAMQWAVAEGIIKGRSNTGLLDPKGYATRVECAAVIQRYLTGSSTEEDTNSDYYAIMGSSAVTVNQMVRYYNANASYPDFYSDTEAATIEDFCRIYYEEAGAEGVKAEVAFCQAMKETGFLRFGGDVGIEQYNFAGLGATGNGATGIFFDSPRIGIRAQIQHLKAYASEDGLNQECVDPRFKYVTRGCAPYVEWLGIRENPYGKGWATSPGYGNDIVKRINNLKNY